MDFINKLPTTPIFIHIIILVWTNRNILIYNNVYSTQPHNFLLILQYFEEYILSDNCWFKIYQGLRNILAKQNYFERNFSEIIILFKLTLRIAGQGADSQTHLKLRDGLTYLTVTLCNISCSSEVITCNTQNYLSWSQWHHKFYTETLFFLWL